MKLAILRSTAAAALLAGLSATPAGAQQVNPEQRIERLERQLRQVQRQVFPQGQPADTAGFSNEPAATLASVSSLDQRLAALERQLADILRQAEENGHKTRQIEAELVAFKAGQDERLRRIETAAASVPAAVETVAAAEPAADKPKVQAAAATPSKLAVAATVAADSAETDPGELAYDEGYELWRAGRFDQAITSLRAMASSGPGHRRVSWAHNLAGRAMLDKGEARAAAEALLANYRRDPKGERAADSLFYLGQSLMKIGQPGQACKAYAELEDVYATSMRGELKRLLPDAKAQASCK